MLHVKLNTTCVSTYSHSLQPGKPDGLNLAHKQLDITSEPIHTPQMLHKPEQQGRQHQLLQL